MSERGGITQRDTFGTYLRIQDIEIAALAHYLTYRYTDFDLRTTIRAMQSANTVQNGVPF
jgi:hypothetical protein